MKNRISPIILSRKDLREMFSLCRTISVMDVYRMPLAFCLLKHLCITIGSTK